jgi:hypothetical protein
MDVFNKSGVAASQVPACEPTTAAPEAGGHTGARSDTGRRESRISMRPEQRARANKQTNKQTTKQINTRKPPPAAVFGGASAEIERIGGRAAPAARIAAAVARGRGTF